MFHYYFQQLYHKHNNYNQHMHLNLKIIFYFYFLNGKFLLHQILFYFHLEIIFPLQIKFFHLMLFLYMLKMLHDIYVKEELFLVLLLKYFL